MSDANGREADSRSLREVREEWLPVKEAAAHFGISIRAVQLRVQQGTLPAKKDGRRLLVNVAGERSASRSAYENEAKIREEDSSTPFLQHLMEEVNFLREEIARRDQAESELRRLMASDRQELMELRQRLALTAASSQEAIATREAGAAGETPAKIGSESGNGAGRPWWMFWRKG